MRWIVFECLFICPEVWSKICFPGQFGKISECFNIRTQYIWVVCSGFRICQLYINKQKRKKVILCIQMFHFPASTLRERSNHTKYCHRFRLPRPSSPFWNLPCSIFRFELNAGLRDLPKFSFLEQ